MKFSKPFLCCLLVFCLLPALTACGGKTSATQTAEVPDWGNFKGASSSESSP